MADSAKIRCCLVIMTLSYLCLPLIACAQWQPLPNLPTQNIAVVYADSQYVYAGTSAGRVLRTNDNGQSWAAVNTGLPDTLILVTLYGESGLLLLGTDKGAYRSIDKGTTWSKIAVGITKDFAVRQFLRYGRYHIMASDSGLARSSDGGDTWQLVDSGMPLHYLSYSLACRGNDLYAGLQGNGAFHSLDSGITWEPLGNAVSTQAVTSIGVGTGFLVVSVGDPSLVLFHSENGGLDWTNVPKSLRGRIRYVPQLAVTTDNHILGAASEGVAVSNDNGITWNLINDGLPQGPLPGVEQMSISAGEVYIATMRYGVQHRPLSELIAPPSGVEEVTAGAAATRLGQSIPNPTSGDVLIPYSLAQSGRVHLALYNSLLQQVAVVADDEEAAGPHAARLDASALPPGAYFYRLQTGSTSLTRQMIIVR